jgi:HD superfamily phosphohydrolase YqeK
MCAVELSDLPDWSQVTASRLAHITRVTALLERWAAAMDLPDAERSSWRDAGRWHDALRDAGEKELRDITRDTDRPVKLLHGPASALLLARDGESRDHVLEAVRWHTTGSASWSRTGRALYMADYLEPGREFLKDEREFLARHVPLDFDGVFREVVRHRIDWTVREGKALFDETVELWNSIR